MGAITAFPNFVGDATLSLAKLNSAWTALVRQLGGTVVPPSWVTVTAYAVGDMVLPSAANGHHYRCIRAGNTGATPPVWPTAPGDVVADGSVTWVEDGGPEAVYPGNLDGSNLLTFPGWTRAQVVEANSVIVLPFPVGDQSDANQQRVALAAPPGFQAFATIYVNASGNPVSGGAAVLRTNGVQTGAFPLPGYRVPSSTPRQANNPSPAAPPQIYLAKLQTINGYAEHHGLDAAADGTDVVEMDFSGVVGAGGPPLDVMFYVWGTVRHVA